MNYTEEQRQAIFTHDRNVVVIAGAGSGKTRVLADRFVALLEAFPDWPVSSLAAITFTEKAALELRNRIQAAMVARVEASRSESERRFWLERMAGLDSARIGTIHSLCAVIVRANAALLEIDPEFVVLDEAQAMLVRDQALQESLIEISKTPAEALFVEYGQQNIEELLLKSLLWDIESLHPAGTLTTTEAREQLNASLLGRLRADDQFTEALRWEPRPLPDKSDKRAEIWNSVQDRRNAILCGSTQEALDALVFCSQNINLKGGKPALWYGQIETSKAYLEIIRDKAKSLLKVLGDDPMAMSGIDQQAAELTPYWQTAIECFHACYKALKHEAQALDFSDLEQFARQLLIQEAVQRRYQGVEFNHVLVDEFQDTNGAQRDIIYGLVGSEPGRLFVVGDPKQAIYRFRGADVAVFERVGQEITNGGGVEIPLSTSFRAHSGLIGAFNGLFPQILDEYASSVNDADFAVRYGAPMESIRPAEVEHDPTIELIAPKFEGKSKAEDRQAVEADLLAERIQELKASAWPVWDRGLQAYRPFDYGDCAVLFRRTNWMASVEAAFKAAGIPYVTIAGRGYYDRSEVQDVLALLQALHIHNDEFSLAVALRSPLFGLSDDALYGLRLLHPDQLLRDALMGEPDPDQPDADQIAVARDILGRLLPLVGRVTIAELIRHGLDETAFLATLIGLPDGLRRSANVEKLLDKARHAGPVSLGDFLRLIKDLSTRELREGEAAVETGGAVNLMTIHASKGLEFPVVVLFSASEHGKGNSPNLIFDLVYGLCCKVHNKDNKLVEPALYSLAQAEANQREEAEDRRLLYVAMTRAADKLIVSGALPIAEANNWLSMLIARLAPDELDSGIHNVAQEWGTVRLMIPTEFPPPDRQSALVSDRAGLIEQPLQIPPLLMPLPEGPNQLLPTLSATTIARLGQVRHAPEADQFRQATRLRHALLHDAPLDIRPTIITPTERAQHRAVGEIVHKALQFGVSANDLNVHKTLGIYAWQLGLTTPGQAEGAAEEAFQLLSSIGSASLLQEIERAQQVYRELPFTLLHNGRTITGQIDVLYLPKKGHWTLVDYKTDDVKPEYIWHRSRQYKNQLAVYAAAVDQLTGQTPNTWLYFIRPARSIQVDVGDWREALAQVELDLQAVLTIKDS